MQPLPSFDLGDSPPAPAERRSPLGWFLLAAIFLLLVGQNFLPKAAEARATGSDLQEQELALRQAIRMNGLAKSIGQEFVSSQKRETAESFRKLKGRAAKEDVAARLYTVGMYEAGAALAAKEIEALSGVRKKENLAFYEFYRKPEISKDAAKKVAARIPREGFTYKVARMHALEKAGEKYARDTFGPPWKFVAMVVVMLVLFGAFLTGIGLWIYYAIQRSAGALKPLGHPAEPMNAGEADRFAVRTAYLLLIYILSGEIFRPVFTSFMPRQPAFAATAAVAAILVTAMHFIPVLGLRIPLSRIGVKREGLGRGMLWGLAGYAASLPVLAIVLVIGAGLSKLFGPTHHPVQDMIRDMGGPGDFLAVLFMGSIVAGYWEEIAFRGTLQPALSKVLGGATRGIVAAAILFAAIHPQGIAAWIGLGSIGAMASLLAYQTRSLIPSMVMHAVNNALLLTLFALMY